MCLASANAFISKGFHNKELYRKELYKFNDSLGKGSFDSFHFNGISFNRAYGLVASELVNNQVGISNPAEKAFLTIHIYLGVRAEYSAGQKIDSHQVDNFKIRIMSSASGELKPTLLANQAAPEISILLNELAYSELMQSDHFPIVDVNRLNGNLIVCDRGLLHQTLLHLINTPYPMNQFEYVALQAYCHAAIGEIVNRVLHSNVVATPLKLGAAERVKALIDSDVKGNQTIRQLANISGTNECYLKKEFKALTGCSIMDYRQRQRMWHAKSLLEQGEQNIDVLATEVGYQNTAHFIRIFQRHIGVHPRELQCSGVQAQ
jgi:AraC-like DNA-binding protein